MTILVNQTHHTLISKLSIDELPHESFKIRINEIYARLPFKEREYAGYTQRNKRFLDRMSLC